METYPLYKRIERIDWRSSSETEVLNWVMDWILQKKTMVANFLPEGEPVDDERCKFAKLAVGKVFGVIEGKMPNKADTIFQIKWKNKSLRIEHANLSFLVSYSACYEGFVANKPRYQSRFKYVMRSGLHVECLNKTWTNTHPKIGRNVSALFCDRWENAAIRVVGEVIGYLPESAIGNGDEEFLIKWNLANLGPDPDDGHDTHTSFDSNELSNGMKFFAVDHPKIGLQVETEDADGCIRTGEVVSYIPETYVSSGDARYRIKWENERSSNIYNVNDTAIRPMCIRRMFWMRIKKDYDAKVLNGDWISLGGESIGRFLDYLCSLRSDHAFDFKLQEIVDIFYDCPFNSRSDGSSASLVSNIEALVSNIEALVSNIDDYFREQEIDVHVFRGDLVGESDESVGSTLDQAIGDTVPELKGLTTPSSSESSSTSEGLISHRSLYSNIDDDQCTSEYRDEGRSGKRSLEAIYDTVSEVKELNLPYSSGSSESSKRFKSHRSLDSNIDDGFKNHNCMLYFATPCESVSIEVNSGVFGGDNDVEDEGENDDKDKEDRVDNDGMGNDICFQFQDTEKSTSESETTGELVSIEVNSVKGEGKQKHWGARSIFDYIINSFTTVRFKVCNDNKNDN